VRTVRWARLATTVAMGQQVYEARLFEELRAEGQGDWLLSDVAIAPLRSGRSGSRRLPLRLVWSAPYRAAALVGAAAYGRADLLHRLDLRCPPSGRREVVTIHDLPPLRFDDEGALPRWAAQSARAASIVICPSEFAAQEARELLGVQRVRVVPNGVDPTIATAEPLSSEELMHLQIETPFVLHAGGATRRKNLDALAAAWQLVRQQVPDALLVLCGPAHLRRDELFAGMEGVRYVGHRQPAFVARLMRSAAAVVVPSTYEGFGLPALEAMAVGTPVIAAARGALLEVCGRAAVMVEPTRDALATGILEALAGDERIQRLCEAGRARAREFTWKTAARRTLAAYEEALG
jgi:glycosyltransferase involved in cell wall biosynthesis